MRHQNQLDRPFVRAVYGRRSVKRQRLMRRFLTTRALWLLRSDAATHASGRATVKRPRSRIFFSERRSNVARTCRRAVVALVAVSLVLASHAPAHARMITPGLEEKARLHFSTKAATQRYEPLSIDVIAELPERDRQAVRLCLLQGRLQPSRQCSLPGKASQSGQDLSGGRACDSHSLALLREEYRPVWDEAQGQGRP